MPSNTDRLQTVIRSLNEISDDMVDRIQIDDLQADYPEAADEIIRVQDAVSEAVAALRRVQEDLLTVLEAGEVGEYLRHHAATRWTASFEHPQGSEERERLVRVMRHAEWLAKRVEHDLPHQPLKARIEAPIAHIERIDPGQSPGGTYDYRVTVGGKVGYAIGRDQADELAQQMRHEAIDELREAVRPRD